MVYLLYGTMGPGDTTKKIMDLAIVLACALSLVLSAGAVLWCTLFSSPAALRKQVEMVQILQHDLSENFTRLRGEMAATADSVDGVLDSIERKRKQISGARSRLEAVAEPEPTSRADIIAAARARTYGAVG